MEQSALDSNPLVNSGFGRPVHGSIRPAELRALGLDPSQVLDFSASISPLGTPEGLWGALRQVDLTTYPDPENLALREALVRPTQRITPTHPRGQRQHRNHSPAGQGLPDSSVRGRLPKLLCS